MTFFDLLGHLAGFLAPALGLATVLWIAPRLWKRARSARWSSRTEALMLLGSGLAVLVAGLIVFGRDGKMFTYTALVLVQASVAWWNRSR
ncbi:hypothetical protein ACVC7V_19340 [Hydrogenophaga sp. A37]|uniref:hypothetical protein n=1 Tax=Hydrogenophaga sp. A37 TaxID=1945864 RepID=UPI0009872D23|nr:hypothetical protein [Hydrogenophaga sp. A37]OOG87898.1 hypothetical protein B0E41_02985 [Hydrogenophaga sp. A37]